MPTGKWSAALSPEIDRSGLALWSRRFVPFWCSNHSTMKPISPRMVPDFYMPDTMVHSCIGGNRNKNNLNKHWLAHNRFHFKACKWRTIQSSIHFLKPHASCLRSSESLCYSRPHRWNDCNTVELLCKTQFSNAFRWNSVRFATKFCDQVVMIFRP